MNKRVAKSLGATLVAGAMLTSGAAMAELSANAAVTSNYVWRGLTQTDDAAALQGGVDYAHDSGFYVGAWGSNVEEGLEYDLYAGFANEVGDFGYELAYLTYNYTDSDFAENSSEIKVGVSYAPASLNYYIGDAGTDADNEYNYAELNLDFDLGAETTLSLHYGVMGGDYVEAAYPDDNQKDDYSVGVSKKVGGGFKLGLSYADHEEDDGITFVTLSKEFEL